MLGWLLFAGDVTRVRYPQLFESIDSLGDALQPLGVGASLTLCAYLVGATLEFTWAPAYKLLPRLSLKGRRSIYRLLAERLEQVPDEEVWLMAECKSFSFVQGGGNLPSALRNAPRASERDRPPREALTFDLHTAVQDELDLTATRLLTRGAGGLDDSDEGHNQLFDVYDRLRAEAEFRVAISLPSAGLLAVVLPQLLFDPVAFAAALCAFIVLVKQGTSKRMDAGDRVVDAQLLGVVEAPALAEIRPGVFTPAAREEGRIRPVTREASSEFVLSSVVGVPFRRRVGLAVAVPLEAAAEILSSVASAIWRGVRWTATPFIWAARRVRDRLWRPARRLPARVRFLLLDYARTGGSVVRIVRKIRRLSLAPEEEAMRIASTLHEYGYYPEAVAAYPSTPAGSAARLSTQLEAAMAAVALRSGKLLSEFMVERVNEGRPDVAERVCRQAMAADLALAHLLLGDFFAAYNRIDEAEAEYQLAARKGVVRALVKLGDLRNRTGDTVGARTAFAEGAERGDPLAGERLTRLPEAVSEKASS